jgi:hypothetical protein
MFVLLVLLAVIAVGGAGLIVTMIVRDEPLHGLYAMLFLTTAGIMSAVYGTVTSA